MNLIWNYFNKIDQDGVKYGVCKKCEASFKLPGGSTGAIRYHFEHKHPLLFSEMKRLQAIEEKKKTDELLEVAEASSQLSQVKGKLFFTHY